ncbi:SMP-30/gluconolactonase/LRE family protein [Bosea thiooxidans]
MSAGWTVLATGLRFPEGPVFAPDGTLWWVEVEGGGLGWLPRTKTADVERGFVPTGGRPNGAAIGPDGLIWFCDQGECAIRRLDPVTGKTETIVSRIDGAALGKPNDLAFDAAGNLIFTCPNDARTEPSGYVCRLTRDGELSRIAEGLYFPNGLAFLQDGRLVIAETYRHRLWIGGWDAGAGRWLAPAPWVEVGGPIGPDGVAVGPDGLLHVALFGQGVIRRVDGAGTIVGEIATPGAKPTNCCFDPEKSGRLIVTEAERGELLVHDLAQARSAFSDPIAANRRAP